MMILEFISHLARPLSLTLRLFGNIRGEEIVLLLFFLMAPLVSTLPIYFLFLLCKVLQPSSSTCGPHLPQGRYGTGPLRATPLGERSF